MISNKKISVIGGDLRQFYAAQSFLKNGDTVNLCGFEKINSEEKILKNQTLENAARESEYVILPLPITRDGKNLNAPYSAREIKLCENFYDLLKSKKVFGGIISSIEMQVKKRAPFFKDYYEREDFKILNAVPTAEGALKIALEESGITLKESRCLVAGYGRIGKVLASLLKGVGAHVCVSARKSSDFAWINALGYTAVDLSKNSEMKNYNIIFNTIPSVVFDCKKLLSCSKSAVIIDLASNPGGVDRKFCESLGIKCISAQGLPGKFFPETAGKIIKNTIYKIIEEENV